MSTAGGSGSDAELQRSPLNVTVPDTSCTLPPPHPLRASEAEKNRPNQTNRIIDLRERGGKDIVPLVDDVATLTLDVWAHEQGLQRSGVSLAGV